MLAFQIQLSLESGRPYEEYHDSVIELEKILKQIRDEHLNDNMNRTFGILLESHPERIAFEQWLKTADLSDDERKHYIRYVRK